MIKLLAKAPNKDAPLSARKQREIAYRATADYDVDGREVQRAEARAILVRLLVRSCLERRKAAA